MDIDLCEILLIVFILILIITGIHIYIKYLSHRRNNCYTSLIGKTAIVTGADSDIGYYTALDFAKRSARVILACGDREKAEAARKKIVEATDNDQVIVQFVDLQSLTSVREFARFINETEERLDILVNNAGGLASDITEDGLLATMQVNYFSVYLLTHLLVGKLKDSTSARIINVGSLSTMACGVDPENINRYPKACNNFFKEFITYRKSKLCTLIFTKELAVKLEGTGVTVNYAHSGLVDTPELRSLPFYCRLLLYVPKLYFLSAEEGAQTSIYVSVSKDVENKTGKLYHNCKEVSLYRRARNPNLAEKIWMKSEELVKLSETEKFDAIVPINVKVK